MFDLYLDLPLINHDVIGLKECDLKTEMHEPHTQLT